MTASTVLFTALILSSKTFLLPIYSHLSYTSGGLQLAATVLWWVSTTNHKPPQALTLLTSLKHGEDAILGDDAKSHRWYVKKPHVTYKPLPYLM